MMDVDESIAVAKHYGSNSSKLFINGAFVDGGNEEIVSVNPSTGEPWAQLQAGTPQDIDTAVRAAHQCFEQHWSREAARHREKRLRRFAALVEEHGDTICALDALDAGRLFSAKGKSGGAAPIGSASIDTLLDTIHYFAGWPTKIAGQSFTPQAQASAGALRSMQTFREPIGVVACILPWNAPALFMINKVVPALAAGCTVVVKPAEQTPVSALYLAELFREAGFPEGSVNVVNGFGETVGAALCGHPLVKKVTFTGSTAVGRSIAQVASQSFKRLTLELGGKAAFIVMSDADLDAAALGARLTGFGNAGQFCMCPSRLFVDERVIDSFVDKLSELGKDIVLGDALSEHTTMGPVITQKDCNRIEGIVDRALREGADLVFGGGIRHRPGSYFEPTLIRNQDTNITLAQEEVFGPVLLAIPFDAGNLDLLLQQANETKFGLASSIWTRNLPLAHRVARRLECGIVSVNSHAGIDPMVPFGGVKDSGQGREFGAEGFESFFETKSLHLTI